MTETYFAYSLPNETEIHYVKGKLSKIENIHQLVDECIVFCSFDRKNIYQLNKLESCTPADFKTENFGQLQIPTSKESYQVNFNQVIEQIKSGRFQKVVLSRVKKTPYHQSTIDLFHLLNNNYKGTFNYILNSPELGCWIGVTPELLCEIENNLVKTVALAGTKSVDESWSKKEFEEQLYVTNFIEQKMTNIACYNLKKDGPHSIKAGPVQHLKTNISCELKDPNSWRDVIEALHPTPATCGLPTESSMKFIIETEQHDRKLYTGFIGIINKSVKKCFVNLRCMELDQKNVLMYLGGGITSLSNGDHEWLETERKAKTLEDFLTK